MSPNDIDILLHYHVTESNHPRLLAPAVIDSIEKFIHDGIIVQFGTNDIIYKLTERGHALVDMLCETPYPEKIYIDPRFKNNLK